MDSKGFIRLPVALEELISWGPRPLGPRSIHFFNGEGASKWPIEELRKQARIRTA